MFFITIKQGIKTFCIVLVFIAPLHLFAETSPLYTLSGLPGLEEASNQSGDFTGFINTIFRISIGLGAALAVLIVIFSGIQYSYSANFTSKQLFKEKIGMALAGLALLMGAFIFLEFINPDLTTLEIESLNNPEFGDSEIDPVTSISGSTTESDDPRLDRTQ